MVRRRDGKVTIGEVAIHAGVSRATVSRVMNQVATVDPAIAARVLAVAKRMNYAPSAAARSLALGRTHTVGFVVPDLTNPAFHGAMRGLSLAAAERGYRVLVADTAENVLDEPVVAVETRRKCDALVLCAPRMAESTLKQLLPELAPVMMLNRDIGGDSVPADGAESVPVLAIDYAAGIRDLVRHLIELGHRRIAYLEGPPQSASHLSRVRGLDDLQPGLELQRIPCGSQFSDGHALAGEVLASKVTAVLAFNDVVALGLLGALHERDVRVPQDLSVVGFDDIPFAGFTSPSLTTASVPQTELGEEAWHRLWALLNGAPPAANILYRPQLVRRSSSGPPRETEDRSTTSQRRRSR